MKNVVYIQNRDRINDEAGEWISKFDLGLSDVQEREFQEWLCADQDHYDAFMSIASVWDGMSGLSRLSDLFPEEQLSTNSSWRGGIAMGLSAVFIVATIAFLTGVLSLKPEMMVKRYETSIGEQSSVVLADSSVLVLNTNSLVTVDYSDNHRLITLVRGEINIDVARDESRPLSVKAGNKVVQAVGTVFNIELLKEEKFELIVTQGKVRVGDRVSFETNLAKSAVRVQLGQRSRSNKSVRISEEALSVSKGEKVIVGLVAQSEPIKLAQRDIEVDLSWREGNLIFDGQTLEEAISEIRRYTSVEFAFEDEEIKNIRIAGRFTAGDVNGLLLALDSAFEISSKKLTKGKVSLSLKKQER